MGRITIMVVVGIMVAIWVEGVSRHLYMKA